MKKYYAYVIPKEGISGVTSGWDECSRIVSGKGGAKYKGFKTEEEAEAWLAAGANYEVKDRQVREWSGKKGLEKGVYFDSGTGRGLGLVEINVTDETGKSLLHKALPIQVITKFGTHMIVNRDATNNYGELLAMKYALLIAAQEGVKKIFGDSKLVLDYWSKGHIKKETFGQAWYDLVDEVTKLRKDFEKHAGSVSYISGDDNPADLGFHR